MFALAPVMTTSAAVAVASMPLPAPEAGLASTLAPCPRGTYRVRKNTKTKTRLVNTLLATGVGTALGAGIGGKRGALIGAGSGAGGYLVYRYVRDRRGRCVPRRVR